MASWTIFAFTLMSSTYAQTITDEITIPEEFSSFTVGCEGTFQSSATGLTTSSIFAERFWVVDGVRVFGFQCDPFASFCSTTFNSSGVTGFASVSANSVNSTINYIQQKVGSYDIVLQNALRQRISNIAQSSGIVCSERFPNTENTSSASCESTHFNCPTKFFCTNDTYNPDGSDNVTATCQCDGHWNISSFSCQAATTTVPMATDTAAIIMDDDMNLDQNSPKFNGTIAATVLYIVFGIGFWAIFIKFSLDDQQRKILIAAWLLTLIVWAIGIGLGFGLAEVEGPATAGIVLAFIAVGCEIAETIVILVKGNKGSDKSGKQGT